ncbi:MAG: hypothetical protein NZ739_00240 [Verrucomicrobiae bacterium]|nr:hypothetical protein [Verrucomicrobiae bacterium]
MRKSGLFGPVLAGAFVIARCVAIGDTFVEDFATDPRTRGWQIHGDPSLFSWDSTNQVLEVTWDSSRPNSYFYRPLGTVLCLADEFALEFDLRLHSVEVSGWGFEIALGFFNLEDAMDPDFKRGTGTDSPNLFEFDYFPDVGFGPWLTATMTDMRSAFAFWSASAPLELGTDYRVRLYHAAGTTNIEAAVFTNGQLYARLSYPWVATDFGDFRLNAFSVSSYNEAGSGGSIRARGVVDNLVITIPPPPVQDLSWAFVNGAWQMQFLSQTNWVYTLERTQDFVTWTAVSGGVPGTGSILSLLDTDPPAERAFYRVRAYRP